MHETRSPRIDPLYLLRPRILGLRNTWSSFDPRQKAVYAFFGGLSVLFWICMLLSLIYGLRVFHGVEVFGPLLSRKLLEVLLLGLFGMLLFSNVVTALSTFYLSDDLELLLSLPFSRPIFHYGRVLDTLIQSSWMMAMFGLPLFIAYGVVYRAGPTYYLLLAVVIPAFLLVPVNVGVVIATILVNVFPARRAREFMAFAGLLVFVGLFISLRLLRPERLVDAEAFQSVAAYVAAMQTPVPAGIPPRWASEVLLAALQHKIIPWAQLGLLATSALAFTALGRWFTAPLFVSGWARSQEARAPRGARTGWYQRILIAFTRPLPANMRPVVIKDIRIFFRDPAQWSQFVLLVALVGIYLFSVRVFPLDQLPGPMIQFWRSLFAFLNLGMTGFVMAGVATRFQFSAVSGEGRAFWVARTSPLPPSAFLWSKTIVGLVPTILVGEAIAVASSFLLGAGPIFAMLSATTALLLGLGMSGIGVAMGAMYPQFKADNAARAAASPAGVLFMVTALSLVAIVLALEAIPVSIWLRASYEGRALMPLEWIGVLLPVLLAAALCVAAAILPIRRAAVHLWARGV